jgi:urea transport system permease protein
LVNTGESLFSEGFPQLWPIFMGALFIAVVMFFPNGLAGIGESLFTRFKRRTSRPKLADGPTLPVAQFAETPSRHD